jgi:acyl-coenzyme A thioesterase PaaI-like protein
MELSSGEGDRDGELVGGWADDPSNRCIGCSTANPRSLQLRFLRRGAGVEAHYTAPPDLNGAPGIVHGGIQAVMLDEAMGHAIRASTELDLWSVTVHLQLRYRRPVPTEVPLLLRAEVTGRDDRTVHVSGEILAEDEEVLTRGTAEFRLIEPPDR